MIPARDSDLSYLVEHLSELVPAYNEENTLGHRLTTND